MGMIQAKQLKNSLIAIGLVYLCSTGFANSNDTGMKNAPRHNRHALIISISKYADPGISPLPGASVDKKSATEIATVMQVPQSNIFYLQDDKATGNNIRKALQELNERTQEGDRVFVHFSGHGTRFKDANAGGCIEALLAYDGGSSGTITNKEMATLLKPITSKTDKLMVMYDACHSGGLLQTSGKANTRSATRDSSDVTLRPKFSSLSEECSRPVNIKTRTLTVEAQTAGALPQDIIHISASRDNEISFDEESKGGLATQFIRDCMLRDALDLDNSGAVSIEEVKLCAQKKIDARLANDPNFKPHNLVLNGNMSFVPAWFSQASAVITAPVNTNATSNTSTEIVKPLTGEQALSQIYDQRDAKRSVKAIVSKDKLKINKDALDFTVQSNRKGYVYVAMAGSDNKALHLLFPNDLDQENKIEANKLFFLPRPSWRVKASGPAGTNHLLVMVTDSPRDFSNSNTDKAGPFVTSLNDSQGRAKLGALMTLSQKATDSICNDAAARAQNPECSDAFGATMIKIQEID